jgi:hypothetical protein
MMGERLAMQESLFYEFRLEEHVPPDHLLRRIDHFVDCSELRQHLAGFYSTTGRPRARLGAGGQRESGGQHRGDPAGLADHAATGAEMWSPYFLGLLAEALGRAGQAAAGLDILAEALGRVDRIEGRWIEAELYRLRGELQVVLPEADQRTADACFHRNLAVARQQSVKM